jgi:hypothetical protein
MPCGTVVFGNKIWVVTTTATDRSRIEEFLPIYDVSATYQVRINASPLAVYQCLLDSDFNELWVVRLLMTIRTGKRQSRNRGPDDLPRRLQGTGFVILYDVPGEELVVGVAGKFWRPDGGRYLDLTASDFGEFARPGYAKAAWNFRFRTESSECTVLSTETRIKCFGRAALWKFRLYWSLISPFSGLIRMAILSALKAKAEPTLTQAS